MTVKTMPKPKPRINLKDLDLQGRVLVLLERLGDTVEKIRASLKRRKIRGRTSDSGTCPIANYLGDKGVTVWVDEDDIDIKADGKVKTPAVIAAFVNQFDKGKFPELIEK